MPTLTGTYLYGDGTPRVGRVKFTASTTVVGADSIILPAPLEVDLDAAGSFSVDLVSTSDPAYSPSGWLWTITESMRGGRDPWSFEFTANADVADLSPVAVPDAYSIYVEIGDELTASLTSGAATAGQVPAADGAGGIDWAAQSGGGADLSDALPADLGTAAAGVGTAASRDDHVHDLPTAADVGAAAASHTHALTDVTDAGGAAALDVGTTAGTVAAGDDSRLSDARTPTAHASSHATGGSDALSASDIGAAATSHSHAASDVTSGTMATARLGSGTADSTTFLRGDQTWAVAGGAPVGGGPVSGYYLTGYYVGSAGNTASLTMRLTVAPVHVAHAVTIDALDCEATADVTGATVVLVLYNSTSGGLPGDVVAQSAEVSAASTGQIVASVTPVTLQPGLYWVGSCAGSTRPTLLSYPLSNWGYMPVPIYRDSTLTLAPGSRTRVGYGLNETVGTIPTSWGSTINSSAGFPVHIVRLRAQ